MESLFRSENGMDIIATCVGKAPQSITIFLDVGRA